MLIASQPWLAWSIFFWISFWIFLTWVTRSSIEFTFTGCLSLGRIITLLPVFSFSSCSLTASWFFLAYWSIALFTSTSLYLDCPATDTGSLLSVEVSDEAGVSPLVAACTTGALTPIKYSEVPNNTLAAPILSLRILNLCLTAVTIRFLIALSFFQF